VAGVVDATITVAHRGIAIGIRVGGAGAGAGHGRVGVRHLALVAVVLEFPNTAKGSVTSVK
jgi:hypothetical protein